jgi:glycosyltransferase involved in cell wall biosynthesis
MGHHVEVAAFGDATASAWFDRFPAKVHGLGPGLGRYSFSRKGSLWLRSNVARFDAVIIHGIWRHDALSTYRALRTHKIPYFIYPHGTLDYSLRRLDPLRYARKLIYWALCARSLLKGASGVLFASAEEAGRARGFSSPRWRSIVVGSGIEQPPQISAAQLVRFYERFPNLWGKRVILFLGRIHEIKGLDILIRSFSHVSSKFGNLHLLIAGRGDAAYEASLKGLSQSLPGLENVSWAGVLTGQEKWAAFEIAELFVLPSHQDSFGLAVVEALATGTPVMISNKVGIWKTVSQYAAGVVCGDDYESLTANLENWFHENSRIAEIRTNAVACFSENYLVHHAAVNLRNAISAALSGMRSKAGNDLAGGRCVRSRGSD